MPLTKVEKTAILTQLVEQVPTSKAIVFADYRGTTVKELETLRDTLAKTGLKFTVTKNTLLKRALDEAGFTIGDGVLDQPVGLVVDMKDEVQPAKLVYEFTKDHPNLKIHGALINGQWIDKAQVATFAKLPSRDQLLGQVVGTIAAPLTGLVTVLTGNIRGLVSVLKQQAEKNA